MSKPKTYRKSLNCQLNGEIWEKLNNYCNESGLSKTVAVEQAITMYVKAKNNETEALRRLRQQGQL